jgi:hypothetical protein
MRLRYCLSGQECEPIFGEACCKTSENVATALSQSMAITIEHLHKTIPWIANYIAAV